MKASMENKGFFDDLCEYLVVDNSRGQTSDAYVGLNGILNSARGQYVILCHQDILLVDDDIHSLDAKLAALTEMDPNWAVAGNAGGISPGELAIRITDKTGEDQRQGEPFPRRVMSLDENFLVVRRSSRVGFSRDLTGFHMYGTDICLVADVLGFSSYVIDFHLKHLGKGETGPSFKQSVDAFRSKWTNAFSDRNIQTTCVQVHLTKNGAAARWLSATKSVSNKLARSVRKRLG